MGRLEAKSVSTKGDHHHHTNQLIFLFPYIHPPPPPPFQPTLPRLTFSDCLIFSRCSRRASRLPHGLEAPYTMLS